MSKFTEQANARWAKLRTEIDVSCMGFEKPDGTPLETVYLHPLTAAVYADMDRSLNSEKEGERELAVFEFLLRAAVNERGHRVFDDEDVDQLPYRLPLRQMRQLWADVIDAMRRQSETFIEQESENFDEAALPAAAIASLKN